MQANTARAGQLWLSNSVAALPLEATRRLASSKSNLTSSKIKSHLVKSNLTSS